MTQCYSEEYFAKVDEVMHLVDAITEEIAGMPIAAFLMRESEEDKDIVFDIAKRYRFTPALVRK